MCVDEACFHELLKPTLFSCGKTGSDLEIAWTELAKCTPDNEGAGPLVGSPVFVFGPAPLETPTTSHVWLKTNAQLLRLALRPDPHLRPLSVVNSKPSPLFMHCLMEQRFVYPEAEMVKCVIYDGSRASRRAVRGAITKLLPPTSKGFWQPNRPTACKAYLVGMNGYRLQAAWPALCHA